MALNNYQTLKNALAEWLNREGFTSIEARSQDFLDMAQRRVQREVRVPPMERQVELIPDDQGRAPVPTDYLEAKYVVAVSSTDAWYLQPATYPQVLQHRQRRQRLLVFDVEAGYFHFGGQPRDEEIQLVYYREFEFVNETTQTNWFTMYAPELILYAAIVEAATYLKDFELASAYERRYNQAKSLLEEQKDRGEHAGGAMSVRTR